jgi:retron-type reverse transcriptase
MYEELHSIENLKLAFKKAKKGKTKKRYVKRFQKNLKDNLLFLQKELKNETYKPHKLKNFVLRDPKTRKISKSSFRDRVVHHALVNIISDLFEKSFIYDSHANQIGKGTHKALERFDKFKRKASKNNARKCFILKADIKHYFEEINQDILLEILQRKIKCEKAIWLLKKVIERERDESTYQ